MKLDTSGKGTLIIDNFKGSTTLYRNGNINSGFSNEQVVSGQNPFVQPGQLTWNQAAIQIDAAGSVITDMIVAGKERVESGVLYVYAVGHMGRVYKIQVNDPTTYNPDFDNPVLLATLATNSPTFKYGGFIDFFGDSEQLIIGHDMGATKINFNGTGETFIGTLGSWTQNVPRPIKQFLGKMYFGNGTNIAELDSTNTITTYTKLSPGFPTSSQVRDLDLSPDGNYLEAVVSTLALYDITSSAQETISTANVTSYIYRWNGTDAATTSSLTFPSFSIGTNILFQNYQYTFGQDQFGTAVYSPTEKIISVPEGPTPLPNAVTSTGNLVMWMQPLYFNGRLEADIISYGSYNWEVGHPIGHWDLNFINAMSPETDVVRVPLFMSVSNTGLGSSTNKYTNNLFGTSKVYFSTLETSTNTTKYRFYKMNFITTPIVSSGTPTLDAVYQTQTQLFPKKISVSEVRIYGEPWVAGNSFLIDLIGSDNNPIPNGSITLTAGTNLTIGDDFAWYGPDMVPTYALGVSITNKGTTNHVINKIEIDYSSAGK